jgi:hypothetical protein
VLDGGDQEPAGACAEAEIGGVGGDEVAEAHRARGRRGLEGDGGRAWGGSETDYNYNYYA